MAFAAAAEATEPAERVLGPGRVGALPHGRASGSLSPPPCNAPVWRAVMLPLSPPSQRIPTTPKCSPPCSPPLLPPPAPPPPVPPPPPPDRQVVGPGGAQYPVALIRYAGAAHR